MNESRRNQISLRGASAKEITRDALLDRVNQERELRNYARRAKAAALLIQRVWRRHHATESAALRLRDEWEVAMESLSGSLTGIEMSSQILRPFIFFINYLSVRHGKIGDRDRGCMMTCFRIILEDITSKDVKQGFCSLTIGSTEDKRLWFHHSKKLISVCLFVLSLFDCSHPRVQDIALTSTAMRLSVILTDPKCWNCIPSEGRKDANTAVENLVKFVGSKGSGLYNCIRKFLLTLEGPFSSQELQKDETFVIVASAITLSLRPFHLTNADMNEKGTMESAIQQYCISVLTIPWFLQRLPAILVPALRHKSVLSPCLRTLLILKEKTLKEMSEMDQLEKNSRKMPHVGWALANTVCLATEINVNDIGLGNFTEGLEYSSYLDVAILFADNLLVLLENFGYRTRKNDEIEVGYNPSVDNFHDLDEITCGFSKLSYLDLLRPVCQQWHLKKLLAFEKDIFLYNTNNISSDVSEFSSKHVLRRIAYYYSCMLRLFSTLGPAIKSLPILNMLAFSPGFLSRLRGELEKSLFHADASDANSNSCNANTITGDRSGEISGRRQKRLSKETSTKWVNMLHKITGKSPTENDCIDSVSCQTNISQIEEHPSDEWDIESLRQGPEGISKDIYYLLLLFCSSYSHLLLVLDDIEFYEKQVPFTVEQQQKITSMLNTLVYNSLSRGVSPQYRALVDSAVRCLHLLYERNARRQFCDHSLWLAPGKNNRMPIAVAARTHEVFSAADVAPSSSVGSVITTTPHIFPFEERVKMFREFISMDKVARRLTGEGSGPGSRSIEIVVRRGHIFEDGLQQLNSLGSRLKSSIHVSFVSESGLPEAGLDYGGLSKEFLTDLSKVAFSPEHGLFCQTSTADRHLIPNTSARLLDNIIQIFEFLGRIVGKALYEGILLDFYFSHVFIQKLLGRYSFLDELSSLDPELYRNLMYVKHYDGDVGDLSLDFTVTEESLGKRYVIELKHGGKDIGVTNDNKLQYVHAMADYKLNKQILPFSNAFYRGLTDLISPSWLKLFNASEFNQLLSGGDHDIDVDDLRKHTQYTGGYSEGSRTVKLFWEVITGFEPKERCMLLKFVTSCSRAPLLGFKHLHPAFTIHKVNCDAPLWASFGGPDVDRLPSASTCYNTLKLPTYKRPSTLRAKLLYAVSSNAGFELS